MSTMRRKVLKTASVAAFMFVVTSALAATMTITGVWKLGGGTANIDAPANVSSIRYQVSWWWVQGVILSFDTDLPANTEIYVALLDDTQTQIDEGSSTLGAQLLAGTETTVSMVGGDQTTGAVMYIQISVVSPG